MCAGALTERELDTGVGLCELVCLASAPPYRHGLLATRNRRRCARLRSRRSSPALRRLLALVGAPPLLTDLLHLSIVSRLMLTRSRVLVMASETALPEVPSEPLPDA